MTTWIDVHTHLQMLKLTPEEALTQATAAGVERVITIGTNPDDWPLVLKMVEQYQPRVFGTLGLHPHDAKLWNEAAAKSLRQGLNHERIVAVGEIGLDYFYKNSEPVEQLAAFRAQMTIAAEANLPVEIHARDADRDTQKVLEEFRGRVVGLLHCYTSGPELAHAAVAMGYHISLSGVVTFRNADPLRELVRALPLDCLHVETDAPFLTPVPHRGRPNHPALVVHTAEVVAQLKGVTLVELSEATRANAQRLFSRLPIVAPGGAKV